MFFRRLLCLWITISFVATMVIPPQRSYAQTILDLPEPGAMVSLSSAYTPVLIKGLKIDPNDPLSLNFIVSTGNSDLTAQDPELKIESERLIKYFFAALTLPEKDMWVNLSPYEKDRIIPKATGETEMGRDMLAQDYILKQITASLIYPEKGLGKEFWNKIYSEASERFGTTQIPVNTFNKAWIVADKAAVYEAKDTVFVVDSHLKVMLDEDYLALNKHQQVQPINATHALGSQIVREIVLPALEKEVNEGKNFAPLRQIFHSLILAKWYKETLKTALLNQVYSNKNKITGVDVKDKTIKEQIYQQYLRAYKKGVFNYIKEDIDQTSKQPTSRKYFSGGEVLQFDLKRYEAGSAPQRLMRQFFSTIAAALLLNIAVSAQAQNVTPPMNTNAINEITSLYDSMNRTLTEPTFILDSSVEDELRIANYVSLGAFDAVTLSLIAGLTTLHLQQRRYRLEDEQLAAARKDDQAMQAVDENAEMTTLKSYTSNRVDAGEIMFNPETQIIRTSKGEKLDTWTLSRANLRRIFGIQKTVDFQRRIRSLDRLNDYLNEAMERFPYLKDKIRSKKKQSTWSSLQIFVDLLNDSADFRMNVTRSSETKGMKLDYQEWIQFIQKVLVMTGVTPDESMVATRVTQAVAETVGPEEVQKLNALAEEYDQLIGSVYAAGSEIVGPQQNILERIGLVARDLSRQYDREIVFSEGSFKFQDEALVTKKLIFTDIKRIENVKNTFIEKFGFVPKGIFRGNGRFVFNTDHLDYPAFELKMIKGVLKKTGFADADIDAILKYLTEKQYIKMNGNSGEFVKKYDEVMAAVQADITLDNRADIIKALEEVRKRQPLNKLLSGALPQNVLVAVDASKDENVVEVFAMDADGGKGKMVRFLIDSNDPQNIGLLQLMAKYKNDEAGAKTLREQAKKDGDDFKFYIMGIYAGMINNRNYKPKGVRLVIQGNIPIGAGTSSSAALGVAVTQAISDTFGLGIENDPQEWVSVAQFAESETANTILRRKTGKLDQNTSISGQEGQLVLNTFSPDGGAELIPLVLPKEYMIAVVNSLLPHDLSDALYGYRFAELAMAPTVLNAILGEDSWDLEHVSSYSMDEIKKVEEKLASFLQNTPVEQLQELLKTLKSDKRTEAYFSPGVIKPDVFKKLTPGKEDEVFKMLKFYLNDKNQIRDGVDINNIRTSLTEKKCPNLEGVMHYLTKMQFGYVGNKLETKEQIEALLKTIVNRAYHVISERDENTEVMVQTMRAPESQISIEEKNKIYMRLIRQAGESLSMHGRYAVSGYFDFNQPGEFNPDLAEYPALDKLVSIMQEKFWKHMAEQGIVVTDEEKQALSAFRMMGGGSGGSVVGIMRKDVYDQWKAFVIEEFYSRTGIKLRDEDFQPINSPAEGSGLVWRQPLLSPEAEAQIQEINASGRYHAKVIYKQGHILVQFTDKNEADSSFTMMVDKGFRIISLVVAGREMLKAPTDLDSPAGGIIFMAPWVNRIQKGLITRNGRTYDLTKLPGLTKDGDNPIHGVGRLSYDWKVSFGIDAKGPFVLGTFDTADWPGLSEMVGHSVETIKIRPGGAMDEAEFKVRNATTPQEAERDGGYEVYADLAPHPFSIDATPGESTVQVPGTTHYFALDGKIPTGVTVPVAGTKFDLNKKQLLGSWLDHTFVVNPQNGAVEAIMEDGRGVKTVVRMTGNMFIPADGGPAVFHVWGGNDTNLKRVWAFESVGVTANGPNRLNELGGSRLLGKDEEREGTVITTRTVPAAQAKVTAVAPVTEDETIADDVIAYAKTEYKLDPEDAVKLKDLFLNGTDDLIKAVQNIRFQGKNPGEFLPFNEALALVVILRERAITDVYKHFASTRSLWNKAEKLWFNYLKVDVSTEPKEQGKENDRLNDVRKNLNAIDPNSAEFFNQRFDEMRKDYYRGKYASLLQSMLKSTFKSLEERERDLILAFAMDQITPEQLDQELKISTSENRVEKLELLAMTWVFAHSDAVGLVDTQASLLNIGTIASRLSGVMSRSIGGIVEVKNIKTDVADQFNKAEIDGVGTILAVLKSNHIIMANGFVDPDFVGFNDAFRFHPDIKDKYKPAQLTKMEEILKKAAATDFDFESAAKILVSKKYLNKGSEQGNFYVVTPDLSHIDSDLKGLFSDKDLIKVKNALYNAPKSTDSVNLFTRDGKETIRVAILKGVKTRFYELVDRFNAVQFTKTDVVQKSAAGQKTKLKIIPGVHVPVFGMFAGNDRVIRVVDIKVKDRNNQARGPHAILVQVITEHSNTAEGLQRILDMEFTAEGERADVDKVVASLNKLTREERLAGYNNDSSPDNVRKFYEKKAAELADKAILIKLEAPPVDQSIPEVIKLLVAAVNRGLDIQHKFSDADLGSLGLGKFHQVTGYDTWSSQGAVGKDSIRSIIGRAKINIVWRKGNKKGLPIDSEDAWTYVSQSDNFRLHELSIGEHKFYMLYTDAAMQVNVPITEKIINDLEANPREVTLTYDPVLKYDETGLPTETGPSISIRGKFKYAFIRDEGTGNEEIGIRIEGHDVVKLSTRNSSSNIDNIKGLNATITYDEAAGKADKAVVTHISPEFIRGGIDLNASKLNLQRQGSGVEVKFDQAMVARFQRGNFDGILPVITGITPIASIYPLLGLKEPEENGQAAA